jgi:bifunctional non-homologous end joining protein LigD
LLTGPPTECSEQKFLAGEVYSCREIPFPPEITAIATFRIDPGSRGIRKLSDGSELMIKRVVLKFVEPMLLLRTSRLPEGPNWAYELKLDGYRALAIKTNKAVQLRSRNNKDFNAKYSSIVKALVKMPDETVIDGEVVALDQEGRPSFNALQNFGSSKPTLVFYIFDVPILAGRDLMNESMAKRRDLLEEQVVPTLTEPVRLSPILDASLDNLIRSIRAQGLEGLVAKRLDSRYEPGQRSGAWQKMRMNQSQEFVIGGYTLLNPTSVDSVIFGYHDGDRLLCAGSTRNGLTPALRAQLLAVQADPSTCLSVCEPARSQSRALGSGDHRG